MAHLLACAIATCAACSAPAPSSVAAKNYDRKCASVADCVAVYEGHVGCCQIGGCPNTAIAQVALATYTIDLARAINCGGIRPACPTPCQGGRVVCDNGQCTLVGLTSDSATDE